jgi:hypothetical protein
MMLSNHLWTPKPNALTFTLTGIIIIEAASLTLVVVVGLTLSLHILGGEEEPRLQLPRALPGRGVPHPHALLARATRPSLNLKTVQNLHIYAIAVPLNLKLVLLPADAAADGERGDDGVRVRCRAGVLRLHHLRHRQPDQAARLRRVCHGGHLPVPRHRQHLHGHRPVHELLGSVEHCMHMS